MSDTFRSREILIIVPADGDDPEALARAGEHCTFLRYTPSGHCAVEIEGRGRPMFFRPRDLQRPVVAPEMER